jgi:hypothetical protein
LARPVAQAARKIRPSIHCPIHLKAKKKPERSGMLTAQWIIKKHLEPSDDTIEISERVFEVQVAEDVFKKLQQEASSLHQSVPTVVDKILRKELA